MTTIKGGFGNPTSREFEEIEVTIANAANNSGTIGLGRGACGSFQLGSTFDGVEAKVQVSIDGSNWTDVAVEGNEVLLMVVAADGTYPLPEKTFFAPYARIVATTAQTGATTIKVFLRG